MIGRPQIWTDGSTGAASYSPPRESSGLEDIVSTLKRGEMERRAQRGNRGREEGKKEDGKKEEGKDGAAICGRAGNQQYIYLPRY